MIPEFFIVFGVVVMCAVTYIFVTAIRKALQRTEGGFRRALTHPQEIMDWADEYQADLDEVSEFVQRWTDVEIAAAVRKYVFEAKDDMDMGFELRVLKSLGERTHEPAVGILVDPALRQTLVAHCDKAGPPLELACRLLADRPDARIVKLLGPLAKERSEKVRQAVAGKLAMQGSIETLPYVRALLTDDDEYVRSRAMSGLCEAASRGRLDPELGRELFDQLLSLVETDTNADEAATVLLKIDRERAAWLLMGEKYFAVEFPKLYLVLKAFRSEKVSVPRELLKSLVDRLANTDLESYPNAARVGIALELLAEHKNIDDRPYFDRFLDCSNSRAARGAVAGLLKLAGLETFESQWEGVEYQNLTLVQRRYVAVRNMDAEVRNGGFSQFFFNSAGDLSRNALDGFQVMGMNERASLLSAAVARFGELPPSEMRSTRMEQLSKVSRAGTDSFDDLCKMYYASNETVVSALARYVLANEAEFH